MKTKENDFIEIDYIAKTKDDNKIFDLTDEKIAKENNLYQNGKSYGSIIICLGHKDVIQGLDKELVNKDIGKYKIEIKTEEAFGKKSINLIKLVPTNIFIQQNIKPFPGLHVNLDGIYGVIRSVSGGRTIVDFNHPLSGKDLIYDIEIKRIIDNVDEKLSSMLKFLDKEPKFEIKDNKAVVKLNLNTKQKEELIGEIKKRIPEIKEIEFEKTTTPE